MNRPLRISLLSLIALAAVSLTRVEAALAGSSSCGGGGSDSGSGGGGSGGSGWSSSSDSSATPACVDATDIVGYRRCTKFGSWSTWHMPLFFLELGTAARTFGSPLGATTGHVSHDAESFTYRVMGKPPAAAASSRPETALVATARLGFGLSHGLYLAAEGELGGLVRTSAASRAEMTSTGTFGAPSITYTSSLVAGVHAVAGIQGAAGPGSLGAELVGGVRSITHGYESRYLACVTTTSHSAAMPVLEARARASYWLTPFVNLGATAGASLVDRGAWVGGLHLGFVTQAFGGQRD
jgi:hypothetical protein